MAANVEQWHVATHLDAVLDSLDDHAVLTLDTEGRITSWNRGAEKTKGYTANEAIGRHFACFYTLEDHAAGIPEQILQLAIENGRHEAEGWRIRKDGTSFWANVVIQPLLDDTGQIQGFVKVTRDISQRLQVEKLRDELYHTQKQEMVGQLTGGVAHDFNNFLTAIDSSFQLIGHYADDERIRRILDVNKVAIDRSKKLVSQLLAFSRKQVLLPKTSSLNQLVLVFDFLVERAVGDATQVIWKLQPNLPVIDVDPGQFQSALLNLVVNARDAMPTGGKLLIFTETLRLEASSIVPPHNVPDGEYVIIGVSDTGIGMSTEVCERAIEPFFTTKEVGKGTGLGLSQCYGFARQSGGTLTIESQEGKGTTVRIILPIDRARQKAVLQSSSPTILLVDDDLVVRSVVAEMLRVHGHTVIEAEDAYSALEQLHKDVPIDYLFTDIIMPNGMNGLQLVEEARQVRPGLPALLASGYSRDSLREIASMPDDVTFMPKPYTLEDIQLQIASSLSSFDL